MDRSIRTHKHFLHLLQTTTVKQRKAMLLSMTNEQLKVLCEVVYNVYKGTLPLSRYYINKLYRYKKDIQTIIDRDVEQKIKFELLVKNEAMIPWILKPLLTLMK